MKIAEQSLAYTLEQSTSHRHSGEGQNRVVDSLDIWSAAQINKKGVGRGNSKKQQAYGIKKLRELILELAVRGKLVPQDANDEPASVLLEKITEEKAWLVKEGKLKKQKALAEIPDEERPFILPKGWEWVRLGNIGIGSTGKTPSTRNPDYYNGEISFIGPGQITPSGEVLKPDKFLTEEGCEYSTITEASDILMVCIGGSIGKSAIIDSKVAFNQQINCLSPLIVSSIFMNHSMNANCFQSTLMEKATGSATPIINRTKWEELPIPLSPLAEQHRIVSKVDELMALCDQLEQQQTDSLKVHQTLVEVLLNDLTQPVRPELVEGHASTGSAQTEFEEAWARIAEHFDTLFTTEHSIDQLKQTILQLAVMGKLVPQNSNDESARVLLEKIAEEKARLVKEGTMRKGKPAKKRDKEQMLATLPSGWVVVRFGSLISLVSGQHLKPEKYSDKKFDGMIPYLTGPAEFGEEYPVPTRYTDEKRAVAKIGDVLITCKGSGVGKTNVADRLIAISRQLMSIQPIIMETDFIKLLTDSLKDAIRENIVGIAIPGISREDVLDAVVHLPPLAEQHRIVAKVDELMALCDTLKARLQNAQTTQTQLADAFVEQAVG